MLLSSTSYFYLQKPLTYSLKNKATLFFALFLLTACGSGSDDITDSPSTISSDIVAPILTINGDSVISHSVGNPYIDLGAVATDNVDSMVEVTSTGSVNSEILGNYTLTYTASDAAGNTSSLTRIVNVVDDIGPVISLIGEAIITINYGDIYKDLGAIATDNIDNSVTVSNDNSVNSYLISSYQITYTASDAAGNEATPAVRTINVVDLEAPVITLNGDKVVSLVQGREYKEQGAIALDNLDGEMVLHTPTGSVDNAIVGQYSLTYTAIDAAGNSSTLDRTINVVAPRPFITTWKTDNKGISADNEVTISTNSDFISYDYDVDWGDGTSSDNLTGDYTHSYSTPGVYTISISGDFPQLFFELSEFDGDNTTDSKKLLTIEQWGDGVWLSFKQAFLGCVNLTSTAIDTPYLAKVTNMEKAFYNAKLFNHNMNHWDVSSVINMQQMFQNAHVFNQSIGNWDVSSVTNMEGMFTWARAFNQNIAGWDVSSVTNMKQMFAASQAFNQDISDWDVSSVTNMKGMFTWADAFNQNIGAWNVSSVINMDGMFVNADVFNQDIGAWDVSSVIEMQWMFSAAQAFNQDISDWDVSSVIDMEGMFDNAKAFNQDISLWDVSSVTSMSLMFRRADAFNQDIGTWDVSLVTNMRSMFDSTEISTANYDALLQGWSRQLLKSDLDFDAGNSKYSSNSQAAREILTGTYNWNISDGGVTP